MTDFAVCCAANAEDRALVADANKLLRGLRPDAKQLDSVPELQAIATSLFIAVFEALFVVRLEGVARKPELETQLRSNAALFLAGLRKTLPRGVVDIPPEIDVDAIVRGDIHAIKFMVRFFLELRRLFSEESESSGGEQARARVRPRSATQKHTRFAHQSGHLARRPAKGVSVSSKSGDAADIWQSHSSGADRSSSLSSHNVSSGSSAKQRSARAVQREAGSSDTSGGVLCDSTITFVGSSLLSPSQ